MTLMEPLLVVVGGSVVIAIGLVAGAGLVVGGGGLMTTFGCVLAVVAVGRIGRTWDAWRRQPDVAAD